MKIPGKSTPLLENCYLLSNKMTLNKEKKFFTLLIVLIIFFTQECAKGEESELLKSFLLKEQKNETLVKLSSIYGDKVGYVCVLLPYQKEVYGETLQDHAINKFLQEARYRPSEFHWSLAVSKNDSIEVVSFEISRTSNIASGLIASRMKIHLPENFEAAPCSDIRHSAIFKTEYRNKVYDKVKTYFIFGRIK